MKLNKNKKKKINLLKLLRMVSLTLVLVFSMMFFFKTAASGSTNDSYVTVTVCPGDTLWNIAKTHYENENIQETIYEIMLYNGLETSELKPGDTLKIPVNI